MCNCMSLALRFPYYLSVYTDRSIITVNVIVIVTYNIILVHLFSYQCFSFMADTPDKQTTLNLIV